MHGRSAGPRSRPRFFFGPADVRRVARRSNCGRRARGGKGSKGTSGQKSEWSNGVDSRSGRRQAADTSLSYFKSRESGNIRRSTAGGRYRGAARSRTRSIAYEVHYSMGQRKKVEERPRWTATACAPQFSREIERERDIARSPQFSVDNFSAGRPYSVAGPGRRPGPTTGAGEGDASGPGRGEPVVVPSYAAWFDLGKVCVCECMSVCVCLCLCLCPCPCPCLCMCVCVCVCVCVSVSVSGLCLYLCLPSLARSPATSPSLAA